MAGIGDLMGIMGKVQDIQKNMQRIQEEMQQKSFSASSGGGMVTATVNGKGEIQQVKIEPQAVNPDDIEMLEDLITAAVTAAQTKAQEEMKQQFAQMAGSVNLPGLENFGKLFGMG